MISDGSKSISTVTCSTDVDVIYEIAKCNKSYVICTDFVFFIVFLHYFICLFQSFVVILRRFCAKCVRKRNKKLNECFNLYLTTYYQK